MIADSSNVVSNVFKAFLQPLMVLLVLVNTLQRHSSCFTDTTAVETALSGGCIMQKHHKFTNLYKKLRREYHHSFCTCYSAECAFYSDVNFSLLLSVTWPFSDSKPCNNEQSDRL